MKSKQSYILNRSMQALLIAAMLLFIAAVFGNVNTYAADVASGTFTGMDWRIVETASGQELLLGKEGEVQIYRGISAPSDWIDPSGRANDGDDGSLGVADHPYAVARASIPWTAYEEITQVKVVGDIKVVGSMAYMFCGMENVSSMTGLGKINTDQATSMEALFGTAYKKEGEKRATVFGCKNLKSIDIGTWSTRNVESMRLMFAGSGFENLNLSNFNTESLKDTSAMFQGCADLQSANLKTFKTGNVTIMNSMFYGCSNIDNLDLSHFDTSSVISAVCMFYGCTNLKNLNVSGWNTSNIQKMWQIFKGLGAEKLDLTSWNTSNVDNMFEMFADTPNLVEIKGLKAFDTSNVKDMHRMFGGTGLQEIDVSSWNTGKVTDMSYMFDMTQASKIDVTGFDTGNVTTMRGMFRGNESLTEIKGLEDFDTSEVTSMRVMFNDCKVLQELDLSSFNTGKVESIAWMFAGCKELATIKGLDGFDTSNVTDMQQALNSCVALGGTDSLEFVIRKDLETADYMYGGGAAAVIEAQLKDKKTAAETAGDAAKAALYQQAAEAIKSVLGKTGSEAIDILANVADIYAQAVFEDVKQDADVKVAAAKQAELDVAANPTAENKKAAEEALKAAHQAVVRVSGLAANTRSTSADDREVKALQKELAEGAESPAKQRLSEELGGKITSAEAIDTSGKSAASVRALEEAITNAKAALVDENADSTSIGKARKKLEEAVNNISNPHSNKSEDERKYDAADKEAKNAIAGAEAAKTAYETAKAKADELATSNLGSDAAVKAAEEAKKAAEDYAAKAAPAKEKANTAYEAAKKVGDSAIETAARKQNAAETKEADAANAVNAEAAVAYAEQLDAAAEKETDPAKKAELANKAAEAWKDAAGKAEEAGNTELTNKANEAKAKAEEVANTTSNTALTNAIADGKKVDTSNATPESKKALEDAIANAEKVLADPAATAEQKAAAAKAVTDAIKNLKTIDSKVGQEITVAKNVYVITKDPGATWDGEVSLKTAKNAKNVSVPKVVTYGGKSYEVNRVQAGAFRAKKIRKVTLGANIEKLDKNAFKKSKATTIVVKTKSLTKAKVKGALKGSKVKTVQVKVGSKKVNKKFVKKYKKIFTKKNAGKKVTVK